MKIQRVLFSLVFCSVMTLSVAAVAQAKELNSRPLNPLPLICFTCIYPIWLSSDFVVSHSLRLPIFL
ncbi:hypothetical protein EQP49_04530 [Yersinia sp. 2105 StPb PI]|nr:hypothetical protein EQP49_04530 [Yersinia sp. 2105 StPb PI]